jgi:hypothetical protein
MPAELPPIAGVDNAKLKVFQDYQGILAKVREAQKKQTPADQMPRLLAGKAFLDNKPQATRDVELNEGKESVKISVMFLSQAEYDKIAEAAKKENKEPPPLLRTTTQSDLHTLNREKSAGKPVEPKLEENLTKLNEWWDKEGQPNFSADEKVLVPARLYGAKHALLYTPAIGPLERERAALARDERQRCGEGLAGDREPGTDLDRPCREGQRSSGAVLHREGHGGREGHLLLAVREQDAELRAGRRSQGRSRVVMGEDLLKGRAVQRVAVGAVLAHPHAMTPSVTGEDEERTRARRRREARSRADRRAPCGRGRACREGSGSGDQEKKATQHLQLHRPRGAGIQATRAISTSPVVFLPRPGTLERWP